jgi:selenoprotein W-related protein
MAQELLTTFTGDLNGVMMQPSETGGKYNIYVDDKILFSRKEHERFPDIKELRQMIRDIVDPERPLGHSDKKRLN